MSGKNKNYNSIIFLTTLSVCLGLVFVSGSAAGLSHSALAKSFDLKNEIEVTDEFDNNPDKDIPAILAELVEEIKASEIDGKIKTPLPENFFVRTTVSESLNGGGASSVSSISDEKLSRLIQETIRQKIKPSILELADFEGEAKNFSFRLQADGQFFLATFSFSKNQAESFADFLNSKFSAEKKNSSDPLIKQIYNNTIVSAAQNQVFIVTRLPRAAIDSSIK